MKRFARIAAMVPMVAGLGCAGAVALKDGAAGSTVEDVTRALGTRDATISIEQRAVMTERLERAREESPADPSVHELLGLMSVRGAEYASGAAVHFRKALELRPGSAYTWANLASLQYRAGDTGRDFEAALIHAARLGPYEPEVQSTVANFGMAVWPEASPELQSVVEQTVRAGMRRNAPEMLQIALRRGRLALACRHLAGTSRQNDTKWSQLCQSMEATS
jgi:Flp pilus assembly protein TadD